jgi:hypothetical protein
MDKREDSEAYKLLDDNMTIRYGNEPFSIYYTCILNEKYKKYECIKGLYDTVWSNNTYTMKNWNEYTVPKIIPNTYHEYYLKKVHTKTPTTIIPYGM